MPRKRKTGKTFDIRVQITVEEGSIDHIVLEYLNAPESSTFGKAQKIMMAIRTFWQALALQYKEFPPDRVRQAFREGEYLWQLQKLHIREQVGIELGESQFDIAYNRLEGHLGVLGIEHEELTHENTKPIPLSSSDEKQIVQANAAQTVSIRKIAESVKVEVVEDEATVNNGLFNPFGNGIIFRS